MTWARLGALAALGILSACASVGVTSTPFAWRTATDSHRPRHPEELITYRLPATVVDITATYEIRRCTAFVGALDEGVALVEISAAPARVRPEVDPRYWYDIDTANWSGFAVALAEAKLELSDGMLTSVNYRSEGAASNVLSAAVRVAALGGSRVNAANDPDRPPPRTVPCSADVIAALAERARLRGLIERLDAQIASADTSAADALTAGSQTSAAAEATLARRTRLITVRDDLLKRLLAVRDGPLRFTLTFAWTPRAGETATFPDAETAISTNREAAARFTDPRSALQFLQFGISGTPEVVADEGIVAASSPQAYRGVYYRAPVRARVTVRRETREIALQDISVLQFGALRAIPIRGSSFVTRSRGATWRDGALTSVSAGANGASGPALLGLGADLADTDRTIDMARDARELAELQALTALAKAREAYEQTVRD